MERKGTNCPWSYFLIRSACLRSFTVVLLTISFRLLFKFVLKIFYGSIVVENADLIPLDLVVTEFHRIQFGAVALHVCTSANNADETLLEENQREGQEVSPTAPTTQRLWKAC